MRQPPGGALLDALVDDVAQRVHAHARGVDHADRRRRRWARAAARSMRHRLAQVDVAAAHRVLAARLGEAPQQLLVAATRNMHLALDAAALAARRSAAARVAISAAVLRASRPMAVRS